MSAEETNIVEFRRTKEKPFSDGWSGPERDALHLAILSTMPLIEYERHRRGAAKALGCRLSWLDSKINYIRLAAMKYAEYPPAKDEECAAGDSITFVDDKGLHTVGFLVASAHAFGRDRHLLVLADGNGTCTWSSPIDR